MSYVSETSISPAHIAKLLSHGRPRIAEDPEVLASVIAVLCSHPSYRSTAGYLSERARLAAISGKARAWTRELESEQMAKVLAEEIDPLALTKDIDPLADGGNDLSLFGLATSSVGGALGEIPPVTRVEVSGTGLSTARRVASVVDALPTVVEGRSTDEVIVFCIGGTPTTAGLEISKGKARPVLVDSVGHVTDRLSPPEKRARYEKARCSVPDASDLARSPDAGAALADVITFALAARE